MWTDEQIAALNRALADGAAALEPAMRARAEAVRAALDGSSAWRLHAALAEGAAEARVPPRTARPRTPPGPSRHGRARYTEREG